MTMTLDQALALCEHASPMPHLAGQALRVMRDEITRLNELADRFSAAINEMTGPTFMGEPVIPHRDDEAVDRFARAMKAKLAEARAKGRGGWQDKADCPQQRLSDMLRAHVEKGDPRDVANFCMFLHQRGEAILPAEPAQTVQVEETCSKCGSTHLDTGWECNDCGHDNRPPDLADATHQTEMLMARMVLNSVVVPEAPTAEPVAQGEVALDSDELAEFAKTIAEFNDCEMTETPQHVLMRWAEMGLLVCEQFELTKKGQDLLAAAPSPGESKVCNRDCDCVGPCKMGGESA